MLDTRLCGGSVYQGILGMLGVCQAVKSWWLRTETRLSWSGEREQQWAQLVCFDGDLDRDVVCF